MTGIMYRSKKSAESPLVGTTEKNTTGDATVAAQKSELPVRPLARAATTMPSAASTREVVDVVASRRDEVQRVLPHRVAGERPPGLAAAADAVAVAEHVQRLHVVRHERDEQRDGAGPRDPHLLAERARARRATRRRTRSARRAARSDARTRSARAARPRRSRAGDRPSPPPRARPRSPTSATRRAACAAGRTSRTSPGSARAPSARRPPPRAGRRAMRRRTISATAGSARHEKTSDGTRSAAMPGHQSSRKCSSQKWIGPPPRCVETMWKMWPNEKSPSAQRQLLVDVQRRPPDGGEREPDEAGGRTDDRSRKDALA